MKISSQALKILLVVLLAAVSFSLYINSLQGEFLIDDVPAIQNNPRIHDLKVFLTKHFSLKNPGSLIDLLHAVIWKITPDKTFLFHLVNVFAHVFCVILLFYLCNILFSNLTLSFLTSLIFALHPIHTEAISWISGGPYAISAVFFLAALIFYIKSAKSTIYLVLSIIIFLLGLLCGNSAVALPLVFLIYEIFFREKGSKKELRNRKIRIFVIVSLLIISAIVAAIYFLGRKDKFTYVILIFRGPSYLIVITKALAYYLKIIYLPIARGLYHPFSYYPLDVNKITPAFFAALLIIFFSIFLFFKCLKKNKPISFGIALFFINYLPYSNIIPICNIISERYLYLPSAGIAIFLAAAFLKGWEIINKESRYRKVLRIALMTLLVLVLIFYAAFTIQRNSEYSDIITYWKTNINNFPEGYLAYNSLAGSYYSRGDFDEALIFCRIALQMSHNRAFLWFNLGKIYLKKRNLEAAKYYFEGALKINKGFLPALQGLDVIKKYQQVK